MNTITQKTSPKIPIQRLRKKPRNRYFKEIEENRKNLRNKLLFLLAVGTVSGVITYGKVSGFNNDPRGPEGVTLSDPQLDKDLKCLREAFNDIATSQFFANGFIEKNCDKDLIKELASKPNPLAMIASKRDEIFKSSNEYPPGTEEWRQVYDGQGEGYKMEVSIDSAKITAAKQLRQKLRQSSRQKR